LNVNLAKIKQLREQSKLRQIEMANKLGHASAAAYSLKESGAREFSAVELKICADTFNVDVSELYVQSEVI
jgi:DNA-binding XRE family transcriptional regulator